MGLRDALQAPFVLQVLFRTPPASQEFSSTHVPKMQKYYLEQGGVQPACLSSWQGCLWQWNCCGR